MRKILCTAIALCFFLPVLLAQPDISFSETKHDSRVLIVPFDPQIYYNDASDIWAEANDMTPHELRSYLRHELNRRLHIALVDSCQTIDLLESYTKEARGNLDGLYSIISYELRRAMPNQLADDEPEKEGLMEKIFGKKEETYTDTVIETRVNNGEVRGRRYRTEDKYLHLVFHNPDFLPELADSRRIDQFLFINQLEIKGNYGDPYLSGSHSASRSIKVHFSLYNFKGELQHGSFAYANIPFHMKDVKKIVKTYFPSLIRQIINNIEYPE